MTRETRPRRAHPGAAWSAWCRGLAWCRVQRLTIGAQDRSQWPADSREHPRCRTVARSILSDSRWQWWEMDASAAIGGPSALAIGAAIGGKMLTLASATLGARYRERGTIGRTTHEHAFDPAMGRTAYEHPFESRVTYRCSVS